MTKEELKAELAEAKALKRLVDARIAVLEGTSRQSDRLVREFSVIDNGGYLDLRLSNQWPGRWIATISKENVIQYIDPYELANAMRLALPMSDFIRRWYVGKGCDTGLLGNWLAGELGHKSKNGNNTAKTEAARAAGYID